MDTSKKMVLLCGVNGTGKSTVAAKFESDGYVIVDVDKSNFDTKSKKSAYCTHFNKYLLEKLGAEVGTLAQLNQDDFNDMFDKLFEGECNKDASLTLLTMFEKIKGDEKTTGTAREYAIDELYKAVLAPVYRADTIKNLHYYMFTMDERVKAKKYYYEKFNEFMVENGFGDKVPSEKAFVEKFLDIYRNHEGNPSDALTELYENLTGVKLSGVAKSEVHGHILTNIVTPSFGANISMDVYLESKKPVCIDVGSRKFFFVDDSFMEELERMGYAPEVIYMNLDMEKNLNNLFSIRSDKYVISDRLNLTGVTKTYLESLIASGTEEIAGVDLKYIAEGITSSDKTVWEDSYKKLTKLSEENPELKEGIRAAIKEYMIVRQNTLGRQFKELSEGTKSSSVHGIDIVMKDNPNTVYEKMQRALAPDLDYSLFQPVTGYRPRPILFDEYNERADNIVTMIHDNTPDVELSEITVGEATIPIFDIRRHAEQRPRAEVGRFTRNLNSTSPVNAGFVRFSE